MLISTNCYKDSGDANATIDPMGIDTQWENDKAGRRVRLIEGIVAVPAKAWSDGNLGAARPPSCEGGYTSPPPATPRVTEFLWHPCGQLAKLTLENADTGDQVTRWIFGTTLAD